MYPPGVATDDTIGQIEQADVATMQRITNEAVDAYAARLAAAIETA